jgi:FtsZ-interacting cell division protein ZipA
MFKKDDMRLLAILFAVVVLGMLVSGNTEKFTNLFNKNNEEETFVETEELEHEEFEEEEEIETVEQFEDAKSAEAPGASDPMGNEVYNSVPNSDGAQGVPNDCYPKDKLTADDLLPADAANSKWAQVNPAGQGDVKDQNFLTAGYHTGVNTVGQTLRNANYQLRSDPPNPQVKVSPWMQTTIEPDTNRRPLEIGGCE